MVYVTTEAVAAIMKRTTNCGRDENPFLGRFGNATVSLTWDYEFGSISLLNFHELMATMQAICQMLDYLKEKYEELGGRYYKNVINYNYTNDDQQRVDDRNTVLDCIFDREEDRKALEVEIRFRQRKRSTVLCYKCCSKKHCTWMKH